MANFITWVEAVIGTAWAVGFGVLAVIIGFLEHWRGKKFRWTGLPLVTAGALLLLYASFAAWDDQHEKLVALQEGPQFSGAIDPDATAELPHSHAVAKFLAPFTFGIFTTAQVENDGGPSAINKWIATALPKQSKKPVYGHVFYPPSKQVSFPVRDASGNTDVVTINHDNYLLTKSGATIARYAQISGPLLIGFNQAVDISTLKLELEDSRTRHLWVIGITLPTPMPMPSY